MVRIQTHPSLSQGIADMQGDEGAGNLAQRRRVGIGFYLGGRGVHQSMTDGVPGHLQQSFLSAGIDCHVRA